MKLELLAVYVIIYIYINYLAFSYTNICIYEDATICPIECYAQLLTENFRNCVYNLYYNEYKLTMDALFVILCIMPFYYEFFLLIVMMTHIFIKVIGKLF